MIVFKVYKWYLFDCNYASDCLWMGITGILPPPTAWRKYQTHSSTTHCMAKIPNEIPPPPTAWQKSQAFPHHPLHGINSIYDRIFFINFLNQYSRNVLFWNENSKSTWIRVRLKIKNITVMQIFMSEHIFFLTDNRHWIL